MIVSNIAEALLRDRARRLDESPVAYPNCFACGRAYTKGDGRFCSARCRAEFDAGLPPHGARRQVTDVPLREWRVVAGPPGIDIGSHYYGPLLDRKRPQRGIEQTDLIRPRRQCKACTRPLPVWDARGRKVPASRMLCDGCRS